ncbi:MAG: hypothetical protein OK452_11515, partial [Thaumarchaeota archaeon]|nr:hypothetical protein [Nitrososphaerota archaeon]
MSQHVFEKFYPSSAPLSLFDRLSLVSYRLFRAPAEQLSKWIPQMRDDLLKSDMRITPVGLAAVALFSATLTGIVALGIVAWAAFSHHSIFYLVAISPFVVLVLVTNAPKVSKSNRGSSLDNEMPFLVGYMAILAGGGLSLIDTLRQISEIDVFRAAAKEAKRMLIDIDVFG